MKAKLAESGDGEKAAGKADAASSTASAANGGSKNAAVTALERQQQKAEKLRKQLEKVESSIKRKREQQDEGDELRDANGAGASSDDDDSEAKSDDDAPEAAPIRSDKANAAGKAAAAAAKSGIPPAAKKADPTKHCKYYSTGGTCGKKGKCRFVHDPAVREAALQERERNGGRMTLQQRLTLNDKDQEDLTIVKTLQYLKEKGAMKEVPGSGDEASADAAHKSAAPSSLPNLPPAPSMASMASQHGPPSALDIAMSGGQPVRYQGWNLSGFGNTGVKEDA